jgi:hypothetical protein
MGNTEPRRRRLLHALTIVVDDSHGYLLLVEHPQICDGEIFSHRIPYP